MIWYENNKHKCFDFYEELLAYCQSDVDILLNTFWKFKQLYMESAGPDNPIDTFDPYHRIIMYGNVLSKLSTQKIESMERMFT